MWAIDPKIKIEKVSMVFFKNIENYVKIYLSAESSHKWQVDRKMFSNIKSLMKISSEKFTRLAG